MFICLKKLTCLFNSTDQDAISERDFICPAKRRKHETTDMFIFDRIVKTNMPKTDKIDESNTELKLFDKRLVREFLSVRISEVENLGKY
jgi:hypothetical protein